VLALLAEAGGIDQTLNNPQVRLVRDDQIYGTSVDRLFADPALDTTLRGGDKVLVEGDDRFFLSLGATGREAEYPFPRDRISALEALSIMGGVTENRANPQGILVLRQYPADAVRADGTGPRHPRTVFTIDLTSADGLFSAGQFQIMSGDLVYATETPSPRPGLPSAFSARPLSSSVRSTERLCQHSQDCSMVVWPRNTEEIVPRFLKSRTRGSAKADQRRRVTEAAP
jgi:hypothetical protein